MGASGAGKTSVLRALAGLWPRGSGAVVAYGLPGLGPAGHSAAANGHPSGNGSSHSGGGADAGGAGRAAAGSGGADGQVGSGGSVLFLPQKPYMVLGCLRDQLLYPTWPKVDSSADGNGSSSSSSGGNNGGAASTSSGNSSSTGQAAARGRPSDAELEQVRCGAIRHDRGTSPAFTAVARFACHYRLSTLKRAATVSYSRCNWQFWAPC